MKLTFDYKIKFSEKVYTYILQKKKDLSSFNKCGSASHHVNSVNESTQVSG